MSFANGNHKAKLSKGIICRINYQGAQPLLKDIDLINEINQKFGKVQSKAIGDIDVAGIAAFLKTKSYLENSNIMISIEGNVMIKAIQCVPIIRYYSTDGLEHFIGKDGRIMPISSTYQYKALIATGQIESPIPDGGNIFSVADTNQKLRGELKCLFEIHYLAGIITSDTILDALVEQINITSKGKIQLATKVGTHIINIGDTTHAAEKLENLKYFYKYGLMKTGWNKYRKINLEFRNQVVCTH